MDLLHIRDIVMDDKIVVIICATALAITLIVTNSPNASEITSAIITGLFGVAVGRVKP